MFCNLSTKNNAQMRLESISRPTLLKMCTLIEVLLLAYYIFHEYKSEGKLEQINEVKNSRGKQRVNWERTRICIGRLHFCVKQKIDKIERIVINRWIFISIPSSLILFVSSLSINQPFKSYIILFILYTTVSLVDFQYFEPSIVLIANNIIITQ